MKGIQVKNTISKEQKIYEKLKSNVDNKLAKLLEKRLPKSLYEPCDYILKSGGKRLRPFLVLLGAKAGGGKYSQAYNAALAVEIFHNFTLVHDDIMDNADKRRGRVTLHIRNDLSTAILAGDNLAGIALECLLKDCKNNTKSVVAKFTRGFVDVCEGQSYDTDFESKKNVTIEQYKLMIRKKTAALLELSCAMGAEIVEADKQIVNALSSFGRNLGMAFQLQDDLLDIFADEKKFGKKIGRDLIEGKKTFLFLKALEKAKGKDLTLLKKLIKNNGISPSEVEIYAELYKRLGVIEDTQKEIIKYTNLALKNLNKIDDSEANNLMRWLANYLIKRNK